MGVVQVSKEDLDLKNHLIGLQQIYIKLSFLTNGDLLKVNRINKRLQYHNFRFLFSCISNKCILLCII